MVYVILVQVLVLFLMSFTRRLCTKLILVNLKILMWLFSWLIEKLSLQLVLFEMWKFYVVRLNILLTFWYLVLLLVSLMNLTFLNSLKLLIKLTCLVMILKWSSVHLLFLFRIILCSNIWRIVKVKLLGKKEMSLRKFFFVNLFSSMIYRWKIWVQHRHQGKILFLI